MLSNAQPDITIRTATAKGAAACGKICYDAFSAISVAHGFPCDLPGAETGIRMLSMMFSTPGFYSVVSERDGRIVGSNVLAVQTVICGISPIAIDPGVQNAGVGRTLMQAVMDRANRNGMAGSPAERDLQ
jgi:hypothetical protein